MLYQAIAVLILLAIALPTAAQTHREEAEAYAKAVLPSCREKYIPLREQCTANQRRFVDDYIIAIEGDKPAIARMALSLGPHAPTDELTVRLGMPEVPVEACAWRHLHAILDPNTMTRTLERLACDGLSADDRAEALRRADRLRGG